MPSIKYQYMTETQAVWLQHLGENEDGMTRVLSKRLPKRKEPNRIRLILARLQDLRTHKALSHTLTD